MFKVGTGTPPEEKDRKEGNCLALCTPSLVGGGHGTNHFNNADNSNNGCHLLRNSYSV